MNTVQQVAALKAKEIDVGFGVMIDAADASSLDKKPLISSTWVLLMQAGHRLAGLEQLDVHDLASERLIISARSVNAHLYDSILASCQEAGFKPNFVYETAQAQVGIDLVEQGLGVMLGTTYIFATHPGSLVHRPIKGFSPLIVDVFSRKDEPNALVLDFIELATEEAHRTSASLRQTSSVQRE
jgi:DNA-binding transcriptional LysR family regulator